MNLLKIQYIIYFRSVNLWYGNYTSIKLFFKMRRYSPGQCDQMVRSWVYVPEGLGFNPQSRAHTWNVGSISSPSWGMCRRQPFNMSFFTSMSVCLCLSSSFFLFLPFPPLLLPYLPLPL